MRSPAVVVTGASTGIGRTTSLYLASRGFRVLASFRSDADAAELERAPNVTPVRLDVTDAGSIRSALDQAAAALGEDGLDGLVNNAGIAVSGPLEFLDPSDLRRQFEVNVFGAVAVTQAFLPLLRRSRGRIVNVSSISGRIASPLVGPYAMSKFALEAFSDALRRELLPFGMEVVVIEPGAVRTPIWSKGIDASKARVGRLPPGAIELYGKRIERVQELARRMSEDSAPPEEVAAAILDALTAKRPKTRYLVGREARSAARIAWLLPDRILDRLMQRRFRP